MAYGQTTLNSSTSVPLTPIVIPVKAELRIKNLKGNTDIAYVGTNSDVTTSNGYQLPGGEEIVISRAGCYGSTDNIYLIASANAPVVCWFTEIDGTEYADQTGMAFDFSLYTDSPYIIFM